MRISRALRALAHATIALVVCLGVAWPGAGPSTLRARPTSGTVTKLKTAQQELQAILADLRSAAATRDRMNRRLSSLFAQIDSTRHEIESVMARLVDTEIQQEQLQSAVDTQQRLVDQRAVDAYTDPVSPVDVILGATSLTDLQSRQSFLGAIAQSDRQIVAGLSARRQALGAVIAQASALQSTMDRSRSELEDQAATLSTQLLQEQQVVARLKDDAARARSLVKTLDDKVAKEEAQRAIQAAGSDPVVPPPPPGTETVRRLIEREFGPQGKTRVDQALCVGYHESHYNASAVNVSSGAAGVFQFMPETWGSMSVAAGFRGASVFDATANVSVAAWTVGRYGWSPWTLDGPYCGF